MEERRRLGGEQMEVGESRNKRYVNPRNGAVYSSHKKANKTFFRSRRYTPGSSSTRPALPFATPRLPFLPPEKWQRINRRWDKECETWLEGDGRGGLPLALRLPVIRPLDDGFSREAERNRSTYCLELISRVPLRPRTRNRFLFFLFFFFFYLDSEAAKDTHSRRDLHVGERGWRMRRVIVEISVKREKMQTVFLQLSSLLHITSQLEIYRN